MLPAPNPSSCSGIIAPGGCCSTPIPEILGLDISPACNRMDLIPTSLVWNGTDWSSGFLGCSQAPNVCYTPVHLFCLSGVWYIQDDGALWGAPVPASNPQCPDANHSFKLTFNITIVNPGTSCNCCGGSSLTITVNG